MNQRFLYWGIVAGGFVADQLVKSWVRGALPQHGGFDGKPWPGVFEITHVVNEGIAFGLFQGYGVLLAPVAVGIVILTALYSARHPKESNWVHAAMALLATGALGNLFDRIFHGRVTDMFQIRAFNFPVFNVADVCITVAATILILKWGIDAVPHSHAPGPETQADQEIATPGVQEMSPRVEPREAGRET